MEFYMPFQDSKKKQEPVTLSKDEILSKLTLIERHLGYSTMCFYVPTCTVFTGDEGVINAQKEASQMLKHVGLTHHIPLITFTKTESSVGGNIELDYDETVFININENYRPYPDMVMAVMAHEICHKVLFVNGLYFSEKSKGLENELLTDLATVYVGFGKLSLNGCYWEHQHEAGQMIITHTKTLGYISLQTFATAYSIVCSVFDVPKSDRLKGLDDHAFNEVIADWSFHQNKISVNDLSDAMKIGQEEEAKLSKYIYVLETILPQLKDRIKHKHNERYTDLVHPFDFSDKDLSRQQFLATQSVSKYRNREENDEIHRINKYFSKIINTLITDDAIDVSLDEAHNSLRDITCPICGRIKANALKGNKKVYLKCPWCNYHFIWDGVLQEKKKGLFSKLFKTGIH